MNEYGLLVTLFVIGVTGAFFSGMLGLGGAIILVPMMLYIPPLLGVGILNMKQVAGITIVVVFVSSLAGVLVHSKNRQITFWNWKLISSGLIFRGVRYSG
jgi:hypothetical protein